MEQQWKDVRKISTGVVAGKVNREALIKAGKITQMRVWGVARNKKVIETDYGDSIKFLGEFRAVNADGEMFRSSVLYLPKAPEENLAGALGADVTEVEFAFDIQAIRDDDLATGYYFDVQSLTETKSSEAVERLTSLLLGGTGKKALAAPAEDAEKAPKPTTRRK